MSYVSLSSGIATVLSQVSALKHVYEYEITQPDGYPCATVTPAEIVDNAFLDSGRNRRSYVFSIKVMQERTRVSGSTKPERDAERLLRELVDEIIQKFDDPANNTLSGACIFSFPIPAKWGYRQSPDVDVRIAEIMLQAVVVSQ